MRLLIIVILLIILFVQAGKITALRKDNAECRDLLRRAQTLLEQRIDEVRGTNVVRGEQL